MNPLAMAGGGNAPPRDVPPSELVRRLIDQGRPKSALVDYPRFTSEGKVVCQVRLRALTEGELESALANARRETARLLSSVGENALPWRPEELEHNTRCAEILAVACRHPDPGPNGEDRPFFEHGIFEVRQYCTPEELGVLMNHYATLVDKTHPNLSDLSESEMRAWIDVIAKGVVENPFAYFSRARLEILCEFCARCMAEQAQPTTGHQATLSWCAALYRPCANRSLTADN